MILEINGSTKNVRKYVEIATWNYAERLMGKRLMSTLCIKINLNKKLLKEEGCEGTCIWDEWDDYAKTPRDFEIVLDTTINIREILINLAHEMTHVKQWVKGEMYEYCDPNKVRWMKKKYDMSNMDYYDYPWEIDAFGRQLGLFVRMCEETGNGNNPKMMENV
jgi:hypothetical protein